MYPTERTIKGLQKLKRDKDEVVIDVMRLFEDFLLDQNKRQLSTGVNTQSKLIRPKYAQSTIRLKKKKGQPHNIVTLRDEGDFYDSRFMVYENDAISMHADYGAIGAQLIEKYGEEILGFSKESLREIQPDFIRYLKARIDTYII